MKHIGKILPVLLVLLLSAALLKPAKDTVLADQEYGAMEVHFMDVGQGDSTLITCGGQTMLIDAGDDSKGTQIQSYLKNKNVDKIDYLVLTHPDSDHIGGAPVIITKFDIGQVFMSNFEKDNRTYQKVIQALDYKRLKFSTPQPGSTFPLGSANITILGPVKSYDNPNDGSLVLLIQNGDNRFLFSGDAEENAERDILETKRDIKADVYKAGHHGSKSSSSKAFLDAIAPEYGVISCGEDNSYGHPHAQTLNSLRIAGIKVFRTDEQGTMIAKSDGRTITFDVPPSDTWKAGEPSGSSKSGGSPSLKESGGEEESGTEGVGEEGAGKEGAGKEGAGKEGAGNESAGKEGTGNESAGNESAGNEGGGNEGAGIETSGNDSVDNGNQKSVTYVLNTNTKKFHLTTCSSLPTSNRKDTDESRSTIISKGYSPCKRCNP